MTTITNNGVQVSTTRQWTYALSPNAAGTGWNYIAASYYGAVGEPVVWNLVKDLTNTPTFSHTDTTAHNYPNSNFQIFNQNRALNGRIFFPCYGNNVVYYDPTTETINELATIVETPPVDPNASTTLFSSTFDTAGMLYLGTQESHFRQAMIASVNPTTLAQTVLGYVGSGAGSYTTYAYRLAADTVTASKYIYVAYGENPWQLWALNITSGVATKLYEVPATGNIFFTEIVGKGWIATIDTALNQPGNVRTQWWCQDGAIYAYTAGSPAPVSARSVTPGSLALVTPPDVNGLAGAGIVRWRAYGSVGAYTTVNYPVFNANPVQIESLSDWSGGIVGNVAGYQGFFRFTQPSTSAWFGSYPSISKGPRLTVGDKIYAAGYPNGVLVRYDPVLTWDGSTNPTLLGYVGLNGTQYAGIKYSDYMAWAPNAGAQGRIIVAGSRERNADGSGIGSWDKATNAFAGTYAASGMSSGTPRGLCVLNTPGRIVLASASYFPPASPTDGLLYVFDYDFNLIWSGVPIAGVSELGQVYETSTTNVICGIRQGTGNTLNLWSYNVSTHTLLSNTNLGITGTLQPTQYRRSGTSNVYVTLGTNIVRVDVDALTGTVVADVSSIPGTVDPIAIGGDGVTVYAIGGLDSGVSNASLYSFRLDNTIAADPFTGHGTFTSANMSNGGSSSIVASSFTGHGTFGFADFQAGAPSSDRTGNKRIQMRNGEGSTVLFGQPVYTSGELTFSLARADIESTSRLAGVTCGRVEADVFGAVVDNETLSGTRAQWDAVCGTTGGLAAGTVYYLSEITPGRLTATPPSSGLVIPVLRALSATLARVSITRPVKL